MLTLRHPLLAAPRTARAMITRSCLILMQSFPPLLLATKRQMHLSPGLLTHQRPWIVVSPCSIGGAALPEPVDGALRP